ncbi:alpha/beta fold hydrolase [Lysobacter sp. cf310]|uniref:alpha/beta fold hydrolase n=1 Tax=Lysobacter sp. cf310 TaxID=1761790 RepID=UPI0008F2467F|nr:alpha/beta hydrolase [Lysobacter sp. cf310]SFK48522.1 Pimeloyl-ACP methyl ester carboxylesterase [Lysobacter sp. cf310]
MNLLSLTLWACTAIAVALPAAVSAAETRPATTISASVTKGRQKIDGIDYYYEIHGKGEPLLLLHGGLGSTDMFGVVLPQLAAHRQVIAVDYQGHGRTPLGDRPFSCQANADDMAALVAKLGHPQVDVLGYSLGGCVALRMAIQKPASVRRLALVSAAYSDEGFYPGIRAQQNGLTAAAAPMMKDTPMYQSYAAVAPNVDEFPRLLDTLGDFMRAHFDWSAEVKQLKLPVMLVYGDGDMYRPEYMVKFYQLLGGGLQDAGWGREALSQNRLAILPDLTHYDIFASPRLATTVLPFLDGSSDAKSWAEQVKPAQ